jgi:hypothetical protein
MRESEQHRFENMRSLLDDKARELITFQKQLRQQIARLVSRIDSSCCHFLKYLYGVIFLFEMNRAKKPVAIRQFCLKKSIIDRNTCAKKYRVRVSHQGIA